MIDYQEFLDEVRALQLFDNEWHRDAAIKAVLGMVASRMQLTQARKMTELLPEPLTLEKLRSHQNTPTPLSIAEYVRSVGQQFKLTDEQARQLINTVWQLAKDSMGADNFVELSKNLPGDWAEAMRNVNVPRLMPIRESRRN